MKKKFLKNKIIVFKICILIFVILFFLFNMFLISANKDEEGSKNNSQSTIEKKISLNEKHNNEILLMEKDISQLEEKLISSMSQEGTIPEVKKQASDLLDSYFLKNFKIRLKMLKTKIEEQSINNKTTNLIEQMNIITLEFNQMKNKINEIIKNLFKQNISEEEFQAKIDYILSDKEADDGMIPLKYIILRENILRHGYQRDNRNALQFEQILDNYKKEINRLQLEQIFHENNLKQSIKELNDILIKDIESEKEMNIKENLKWESFVKNKFVRNDEYIKYHNELEKIYVKRQEIIQSVGNAKFKLGKAKSELNYYNVEIKKLQKEYQKRGECFVVFFGKLSNKFKHLNKFKKNPELDLKYIEDQLKEVYNIV